MAIHLPIMMIFSTYMTNSVRLTLLFKYNNLIYAVYTKTKEEVKYGKK